MANQGLKSSTRQLNCKNLNVNLYTPDKNTIITIPLLDMEKY